MEKNLQNKNEYVIEMLNITKTFPGLVANDNVTLKIKQGEIHALLGENGAGKSTLMSILFGLYQSDSGTIKKNGKEVKITNPNDATSLNIGMVHQHFKLVEVFTVLDNIILGSEPCKSGIQKHFIDRKIAREKIIELSQRYGLYVDPDSKISEITVGMQQRVEILKMLFRENEVLIFDEPTAVLTPQEISELLQIMKNLTQEGKSVIFITHKLNEIKQVCDRCTVLRKGKYIGTVDVKNTSVEELSKMMVGRDVEFSIKKNNTTKDENALVVEHLSVGSNPKKLAVKDVSFTVKKGEIVSIAGIDGNGQSELINAITGLCKPYNDSSKNSQTKNFKLCIDGKDFTHKSIRQKSLGGLSFIPEDRQKHGLVLDFLLEQNIVLKRYFQKPFSLFNFINKEKVTEYSDSLIEKFDVRSSLGSKTVARSMSGGNQQKAIVARELDNAHSVLIACQVTRGLDVGAIEFIHNQLLKDKERGAGILLVSYELDEVMKLSDRILVMYEGEITGELIPEKTNVTELGLYMSGAKRDE